MVHQTPKCCRIPASSHSSWLLVLLAIWFLLTTIGLPLTSVRASHPDCPCGCQTSTGSCHSEKGNATSCCALKPQHEERTCCQKAEEKAPKTGCCAGTSTLPERSESAKQSGWNVLCRCGETSHHQLVLNEQLNLPPLLSTVSEHPFAQPTMTISVLLISAEPAPPTPPPRIETLC